MWLSKVTSWAMKEIPPHPFLTEPVLYVNNLPAHITDEIIMGTLQFCLPCTLRLTRDSTTGVATGSIEFRTIQRAEKALATLDGRVMTHAVPLHLDPSPPSSLPPTWPPPAAAPRLVSSLPPSFSDSKLFDTFRGFGAIASCRMHPDLGHDVRIITFWREEDATRAEEVMHMSKVDGFNISVKVWHRRRGMGKGRVLESNPQAPSFVPSGLSHSTLPDGIQHQQGGYQPGVRHVHNPPLQPFTLGSIPSPHLQPGSPFGADRRIAPYQAEDSNTNMDYLKDMDVPIEVTVTELTPRFCGGYSDVYIGRFGDKIVAVKVIRHLRNTSDKVMRRKMERERKLWGALNHPNIVPLYGHATNQEIFGTLGALISPWYQNGDAAKFLARHGQGMDISARSKMWMGVIAGVHYLHAYSPVIVHGDLKPGNILIDEQRNARLCDFGISRELTAPGASGLTTTSAHTGTERYLAYELLEDECVPTTASDVYALACIGLEFIYVQVPHAKHRDNVRGQIFRDIQAKIPPAVRSDSLSGSLISLWGLLESCWQFEPASRPHVKDVMASHKQWHAGYTHTLEQKDQDQVHTLASLAKLPAVEIVKLASGQQNTGLPVPNADPAVVKSTDEFMDGIAGKPMAVQKQLVGAKLFKTIEGFGIRNAPKVTISLLDSEDLRSLAHLMNSYPSVLKEKARPQWPD